jgi:hypothetical protein
MGPYLADGARGQMGPGFPEPGSLVVAEAIGRRWAASGMGVSRADSFCETP